MQQIDQGNKSATLAIPIIWFWAPLLIGLSISIVASFTLFLRYLVVAAGGVDSIPARVTATAMETD